MGRSPCCDKVGLKRGPWTPEEDRKLSSYIQQHGHGSWRALPPKAGLDRCGKSCRLRWTNYLRPDIKRGKFSLQEEQTIIQLHALLGNRWSAIASHLSKRTDNEIKNYWNTYIKKKLTKKGIDPTTHKPMSYALIGSRQPKDFAKLSHMAQWETTRLEAEARIVRESKSHLSNSCARPIMSAKKSKAAMLLPPRIPRPPCLDILKAWQATNKPGKDILAAIVNNGGGGGGGSLESPTSIFNFSDNNVSAPAATVVGVIHEGSSSTLANMTTTYVGKTSALANNYGDSDGRGKGIMGSSLEVHDDDNMMDLVVTASSDDTDDSFRFPVDMKGFADLALEPITSSSSTTMDDNIVVGLEDTKISFWSDIWNVANSTMDAASYGGY